MQSLHSLFVNSVHDTVLQTLKYHTIHYDICLPRDCSLNKNDFVLLQSSCSPTMRSYYKAAHYCVQTIVGLMENVKLAMNISLTEVSHWSVTYIT